MVILTIPVASISAITNIVTSPITSVSLDFSIIAGDWTGTGSYEGVNWVSASRTLTLTNANVYGNDSSSGDCYGMNLPSDTTIILNGNSTVTGGVSASTYSYGIYSEGSLTIQGEGSLSVTSGTGVAYVCGICVATGTMTVSSGNIVATGGTAASSYGIVNNDGDIIISGGNVTVTGGTATNSYGIVSPKSLYVTGGTLVATGGVASTESYGIRSTVSTSLSGGLIVAKGTTKALYSAPIGEISTPLSGGDTLTSAVYGTSEYKVLTTGLDCSTLTEDTGTLFTNGYEWINSTKTLTIENLVISTSDLTALYFPSGATLNVQGVNVIISGDSSKGNAKSRCIFGIGALNIQGDGAVTTISGKADYSISIYTNTNINISGCKVTAIGGNSNRCSYGF